MGNKFQITSNGKMLIIGTPQKMMLECCCHKCQWAVNFKFYCVGGCNTDGDWEDGLVGCCPGEYPAWAPSTNYAVGTLRQADGSFWVCITQHTSGSSWDSTEQAYWSNESQWLQDGDPYCTSYDYGETPHATGLFYDASSKCSATRYADWHYGPCSGKNDCPATPDVSLALPTDYDKADLCGPRHYGHLNNDCYSCDWCNPGEPLPCKVQVQISGVTYTGQTSVNGTYTLAFGCDTSPWTTQIYYFYRVGAWEIRLFFYGGAWRLEADANNGDNAGYMVWHDINDENCDPAGTSDNCYWHDSLSEVQSEQDGTATVTIP